MIKIINAKGEIKKINQFKTGVKKDTWIDITDITKTEAEIVQKAFNLHPLTTEDLVKQNTRIKVEEFPDYLFCVFYGITSSAKKNKSFELVEIDFVLGKNFIITNHKKDIQTFNQLTENKEKIKALFQKGNDFIFHKLLDMEIDNFFPVLEQIDDEIEQIEEEVTRKPESKSLSKILAIKRQVVTIKKSALPQREKISFLTKNDYIFISKKALPYFRDVYDHAIRVSDTIDNYREAIGSTFDAYMSSVSNSMNDVMKTLSIIATIALPLSVISGIYGTNFAVLPGQNLRIGFWIMIGIMLAVVGGMALFFKRRGWY